MSVLAVYAQKYFVSRIVKTKHFGDHVSREKEVQDGQFTINSISYG